MSEQQTKLKKEQPHRRLQDNLIRSIMILMSLLFLVFAGLQSHFYRRETEDDFEEQALSYAKIAARLVERADIEKYAATHTKDEAWYAISDRLEFLWEAGESKYLYIVIPQENGYLYLWDIGDGNGVCDLGDFDDYYAGGDRVMMEALQAPAGEHRRMVSNHPVYGYVVSVFTPVYNPDHPEKAVALACVDLDLTEINEDIWYFLRYAIGILILFMIAAAIGFYFGARKTIVNPIKKLEKLADGYVHDQMAKGVVLDPDIHTGDEIEALANAFTSMSAQMRVYIQDLEKAIKEEESVRAELDVSRRVQEAMLPRTFPAFPDLPQVDLYASMHAAKEVGGDFYDYFRIDEDRIGFCIADVSGKGIAAAMFMAYSKTLMRIEAQNVDDPGTVFTTVNKLLCENNEAEMFVTSFLAVLNLRTRQLTYVNAGHCPPLLRHAGGEYTYMKLRPGFVLAGIDTIQYRAYQIELQPGDELMLYTDGVTEAMNSSQELFGEERLKEVLNRDPGGTSEEQIGKITEALKEFSGTAPQFDDVTMLSFRLLSERLDIHEEI